MAQCIFCQYATDRTDVLRKHYQRHHPTPASVCDEAKKPLVAVIHPGNPKVAIPVDAEGKMLKLAYCWGCWHPVHIDGQVSMKQGGIPGYIDRNHTCKEKQVRPKRGPKTTASQKPTPPVPIAQPPKMVVQEVAGLVPAPASDDNPFRTVVLDLLEDKQIGHIIREELPPEPDSDDEFDEDDDDEPISSRDVIKAAIFRSVRAMDHARKAAAKVEPIQKALSAATEQIEVLHEENDKLRHMCAAIKEDAEHRIASIRVYEAECRQRDLEEMAARKDKAILALVARLADATGMTEDDVLEGM